MWYQNMQLQNVNFYLKINIYQNILLRGEWDIFSPLFSRGGGCEELQCKILYDNLQRRLQVKKWQKYKPITKIFVEATYNV